MTPDRRKVEPGQGGLEREAGLGHAGAEREEGDEMADHGQQIRFRQRAAGSSPEWSDPGRIWRIWRGYGLFELDSPYLARMRPIQFGYALSG